MSPNLPRHGPLVSAHSAALRSRHKQAFYPAKTAIKQVTKIVLQHGTELAVGDAARRLAVLQRAAAALAAARMPARMQAAADAARGLGHALPQTLKPNPAADPPAACSAAQAHMGAASSGPHTNAAAVSPATASPAAPAQQERNVAGAAGGALGSAGRCGLWAAPRHARGWARPVPNFAALHAAWAGRLSAARAALAHTAVKPFRLGVRPARRLASKETLAGVECLAEPAKACGPWVGSPGGAQAATDLPCALPLGKPAGGAAASHDSADATDARPEGCRLPAPLSPASEPLEGGQPIPNAVRVGPRETLPHALGRTGGCTGACLAALQRNMAALRSHTCAELHAERLVAEAAALRLRVVALFA